MRDGLGPDRPDALHVAGAARDAVGGQRPQQLAQQERVPAGLLEARPHERVGARRIPAHERRARRVAERARLDHADVRRRGQLREQLGLRAGLARAHGGDDEHPEVLAARGELDQQADRLGVGPVEVVDDQDQRPLAAEVDHEPVQGVDQRRLAAAGERLLDGLAAEQHRLGQRRAALERRRARRRRRVPDPALEQPQHDAEREVALEHAAGRLQHRHVPFAREPRGRAQQPRLAEPSRGADEHDAAAPVAGGGDRLGQRADLGVALEQRPLGVAGAC